MAKVEVEIARGTLGLQKGLQEAIARRSVALLEKQAAANTSSAGGSLGNKKDGTPVTLKQSGELWRRVGYREEEGECTVDFRAPHAPFVFDRYNALGLSQRYQQQLETETKTLIEEGVIIEEE